MRHRLVEVEWDTSGEETEWVRLFDESELPEFVTIHEYVEEDDIPEWISARYGFCVIGWNFVEDSGVK